MPIPDDADDPILLTDFIRRAMPRAHDSKSSLENLARVNPGMLVTVIEFAMLLGFQAAMHEIQREAPEESVEKLRAAIKKGGPYRYYSSEFTFRGITD